MSLYEKLIMVQRSVPVVKKDGNNKSDNYTYVTGVEALNAIRPAMDELGLLLVPKVESTQIREGTTRTGTTKYFTEIYITFTWHDVETGEELACPWYAQGVDLGGERGVGKAYTYAEKTFLLKFFHVAAEDDPDSDNRTKRGEPRQKGTQAEREKLAYMREAIPAMLTEMCESDAARVKNAYLHYTKNEARGFAGWDSIEHITDAALPVVYGKVSKAYSKHTGHDYEPTKEAEAE